MAVALFSGTFRTFVPVTLTADRSGLVVAEIDGRDGAPRLVVQSPYRFSAAASGVRGPAPFRGEHNAEVLAEWAGLSERAMEALRARGVLLAEESAAVSG
jgi:crotonobetainyl-CoA:carnitine CoA-transferase CaiB-like acyl-CoA transferase